MNSTLTAGTPQGTAQASPSAASGQSEEKLPAGVISVNTASFALAFAAWVMFGPSVRFIAKELGLSVPVATLIKTLPVLVGSVMRIPLGILTDRVGARLMFPLLLLASAGGVYMASLSTSTTGLTVTALVIGLAGATFVVGVQSVSAWTPKAKQGFALGLFGAGNVGTAITTFGLPLLLTSLGWRGSFRIYALMLVATAAGYWLLIRNAPRVGAAPTLGALLAPLKSLRTWRFGLYYMATFGVFMAATLTVTDIYIDGYKVSVRTAGLLATTFTFSASLIRILGGKLSDRLGARLTLRLSLLTVAAALFPISLALPLAATVTLVLIAGLAMGIGSAATFRYIPDYFPKSVGAVGGAVGALGGLGGFLLPQVGTAMKTAFGSAGVQVIPLAAVALLAVLVQQVTVRRLDRAARETNQTASDLVSMASQVSPPLADQRPVSAGPSTLRGNADQLERISR